MKLQWMLAAAVAAAPWLGFTQEGTGQDPEPRGLVKVAPGEDFDRDGWRARLTDPDLDRRERDFAAVVQEATRDRAAEDMLREWAQGGDELAWTARLALRELERAGGPLRPWTLRRGLDPFRFDPFGAGGDPFEQMRREMERLFEELDPGVGSSTFGPRGHSSSTGRSFQMESTPDGVRITIEETVDGRTETRTFEGESLEALIRAHPELEDAGVRLPGQLGRPALPRTGLDPFRLIKPDRSVTRTDVLGAYLRAPAEDALVEDPGAELGLEVQSVVPGTIAAALQLRAGDVLLRLNGVRLVRIEDVKRALELREDDEELVLELRGVDGKRETLTWSPER